MMQAAMAEAASGVAEHVVTMHLPHTVARVPMVSQWTTIDEVHE
jgi:hypothetical protein